MIQCLTYWIGGLAGKFLYNNASQLVLFFISFLPHSSHQVTINASQQANLFLSFLPYSSHQVTINASQLVLTFVHKDDFSSSHWKASPASSICEKFRCHKLVHNFTHNSHMWRVVDKVHVMSYGQSYALVCGIRIFLKYYLRTRVH